MFAVGPCGCLQCLWVLIVGGTAGYLAGLVIRGRGYNPISNVLLGMAGFFVGSFLLDGMSRNGICGSILVSLVGALLLIVGVRIFLDKDFAK